MITRAEKFLEGFKLGSLGVSKTPHTVLEPEKESAVKIIKEGKNSYSGFSLGKEVTADEPFFCWKDLDGLSYFFELTVDKDKGPEYALLHLYGGENLKVFEKRDKVFAEDFQWVASMPDPWKYNVVMRTFEKKVSAIKTEGVDALITSNMIDTFHPDGMFGKGYKGWLKAKREA